MVLQVQAREKARKQFPAPLLALRLVPVMQAVQATRAAHNATLQPIAGFERTAYARLRGRIVWAGQGACTDHPRNHWQPWQPVQFSGNARALVNGARLCLLQLESQADSAAAHPGLLAWLHGQALPFPLQLAAGRFDAVRAALLANDLAAFEVAALRVLGLGLGLTPSGDDFIGAIFFALAHAPRPAWQAALPPLRRRVLAAAEHATNPISAALLQDLMAGASYRVLHELLSALQSGSPQAITEARNALLRVGASSGADLLAGLLLALSTHPGVGSAAHAAASRALSGRTAGPVTTALALRISPSSDLTIALAVAQAENVAP